MRTAGLLALLFSLSSTALRAQDITPEEREKLIALNADARSRHQEKDYTGSTKLYLELDKALPKLGALDPNRAFVHHAIAVNYTALQQPGGAYKHLGKAVSYGFWDAEEIQRDSSFKSLRKTREFQEIVRKARESLASMAFGRKDLDGKVLEKKDYQGKVLIIDVWGTWCPPCRDEIPHFVALQKKYRDRGLRIIGLTYERYPPSDLLRRRVKSFARDYKMNYPCVMADDDLMQAIPNLQGYPTTFFIDRKGVVRDRISGYHDYRALEMRVLRLLREKPAPELEKKRPAPELEKKRPAPGGEAKNPLADATGKEPAIKTDRSSQEAGSEP